MSPTFRRLASGCLLLTALLLVSPPTPAAANGFGLFGPRATAYELPVETVYAVPTVSSYVVPSTEVVSTSYLLPTSTVVYRPARYTLAPTIYRPSSTLLPTRYYLGGSVLRPTRYYLGDVVSTAYTTGSIVYPSSYLAYPSSVVYDVPVVESAPVVVDRPVISSSPSSTSGSTSTSRSEPDPSLTVPPRQSGNPPGTGRAPALQARPEPEPAAPQQQTPQAPADPVPAQPFDLDSPPAPAIPASPEDPTGLGPLPDELLRQSQRPAFGNLTGATLAATRLVQGRVRGEQDGRPIAGLVVTFSNTVSSFAERRAVTDDRGQFQLAEFLPDGDWSIVISGADETSPTRTYPQVTVVGGRIYDRLGRDYSKLVLDY